MSWSSFQRITADSQEDDVSALATSKHKEGTRVGYIAIFLWLLLYHYFPNLPPTCAWHWKLAPAERCAGEEKLTTDTCHSKSGVKNMKCDRVHSTSSVRFLRRGSTLIHSSPLDSRTSIDLWLYSCIYMCDNEDMEKCSSWGQWRGHEYEDIYIYICTNIWHVALMMQNERGAVSNSTFSRETNRISVMAMCSNKSFVKSWETLWHLKRHWRRCC